MLINDISITHIKSKRKSLTLTVEPGGKVVLRTPNYVSNKEIEAFLNSQKNWITSKVLYAKRNHKTFNFTPGSLVPYKGQMLQICINKEVKRATLLENRILLPYSDNIKSQLLIWYKKEARNEITKNVDSFSTLLGITYNKIFIRNQKTRWGSCSGKKNLNFSWKIILTAPELIKYLVIHEVCHLKEMNHSRDFWNLVKFYDPLFNEHRKDLQKAGYYLTTFLE